MSRHTAPVIRINAVETHPNADALAIVPVFGFRCVARLGEWQVGDLAVYIEPDTLVPTDRPEFAFLAGHPRIGVKRLRGVYSQGLLVPAPTGLKEGDDAWEALGLARYEPPLPLSGGDAVSGPRGFRPSYDVENWRRFGALLRPGEPVVVTEKVHGANGRWLQRDGRFWAGSRGTWKREKAHNPWWQALHGCRPLMALLTAHPELTAYGEIYGNVQELHYGRQDVALVLFDLWHVENSRFLNWTDFTALCAEFSVPTVPVLYTGPYDAAQAEQLAEGPSQMPGANHVREGCVVRPVHERMDPEMGRIQFKIVGNGYLARRS